MPVGPAFGNWLMGFIDGEASLMIYKATHHNGWRCSLRIVLRDDDAEIIEEIHKTLGVGTIDRTHYPTEDRKNNPQIAWNVQNNSDLVAMVGLIDRYGLRAKKRHDYAIWRKAVLLLAHNRDNKIRDWSPMAALSKQLREQRRYR